VSEAQLARGQETVGVEVMRAYSDKRPRPEGNCDSAREVPEQPQRPAIMAFPRAYCLSVVAQNRALLS